MINLNLKLYTLMSMLIFLSGSVFIVSGVLSILDYIPTIFAYTISATVVFFSLCVALCAVHCTHKRIKRIGRFTNA